MLIDVVIPAFNAHSTIENTIISIINQTIHDKVKIIIINDAGNDYKDIVKKYESLIEIEEVSLEENGGPGLARAKGLDVSTAPYITFIDADDIYIDSLFFDGATNFLEGDLNCIEVAGYFLEQYQDKRAAWHKHENDTTWVFGKIYRVSNLRKKGITFSELRSNEDLEFNLKVLLTTEGEEYIKFLDKYVYLWKFKEDSITRTNDFAYSYNEGLIGGLHAKDKAYEFSKMAEHPMPKIILDEVFYMYDNYNSIVANRPNRIDWIQEYINEASKFYKKWCKVIFENTAPEDIAYLFNSRSTERSKYIIPLITFNEFIRVISG